MQMFGKFLFLIGLKNNNIQKIWPNHFVVIYVNNQHILHYLTQLLGYRVNKL